MIIAVIVFNEFNEFRFVGNMITNINQLPKNFRQAIQCHTMDNLVLKYINAFSHRRYRRLLRNLEGY